VSPRLSRLASLITLPFAVGLGLVIGVGGFTFWYARGYSYFFNNPAYCQNCHIMRGHYNSWRAGSHRGSTCNDCHLPHDIVGKWVAKADDGFRHSAAFTLKNVQVLRIIPRDRALLQHNCQRCHEGMAANLLIQHQGKPIVCTRCHRDVGHVF